jgi:hypothetical protein
MATNYPTTLDTFTNPTSTDTLDSATVPHAAQHDNINDAVLAIETALGANLGNVVLPARSISTTAPLTGGGDLSANRTLAVSTGSTSAAGVLQLTDSTSSTSTTTAATPNAVKTSYDFANSRHSLINPISGSYYRTPSTGAVATGTTAASVNTTYYTPIQFSQDVTLDRIAIATNITGYSGTASVRLGIFANTNGRPSTVILDAGTVAPSATGTQYSITISQALSAGVYWLAMNTITAATVNAYHYIPGLFTNLSPLFGCAVGTSTLGNPLTGFTQSYNATSGFATATSLGSSSGTFITYVRVV